MKREKIPISTWCPRDRLHRRTMPHRMPLPLRHQRPPAANLAWTYSRCPRIFALGVAETREGRCCRRSPGRQNELCGLNLAVKFVLLDLACICAGAPRLREVCGDRVDHLVVGRHGVTPMAGTLRESLPSVYQCSPTRRLQPHHEIKRLALGVHLVTELGIVCDTHGGVSYTSILRGGYGRTPAPFVCKIALFSSLLRYVRGLFRRHR